VASVGGFVKEYQIEINPDAMRAYGVSVMDIIMAVQGSNLDIGAETVEINMAEYTVRALGYIKNIFDIEETVVSVSGNVPIRVRDLAKVNFGPAPRRGGLDKEGVEAVGGVVVARYGSNPMQVINNVKAKIEEISPGLPRKTVLDGDEMITSQLSVVPFYDRSGLIRETVKTLETAITQQILICIIVVIILILNLRAALIVSSLLPLTVFLTFIIMKYMNVTANIVSLSGIAIAIGVVVDIGVVIIENILARIKKRGEKLTPELVFESVSEVSGALTTAVLTTAVSFIPVFMMEAQEGKLFSPLAYTKTFAMLSAFLIGFTILPTLAYYILKIPAVFKTKRMGITAVLLGLIYFLTNDWFPMGTGLSFSHNFAFVLFAIGTVLAVLWSLVVFYEGILRWCLKNKLLFMILPIIVVILGLWSWRKMGTEFMPALDEGSFLIMPTSMPHTGIEQNLNLMRILNRRVTSIPEIETSVGKWGRVNSALDPAPTQMFENTVNYLPEYLLDESGRRKRIDGKFVRQWRPHIKTVNDIWSEIIDVTHLPGLTSAPKLQPIEARLVMLSTGMRAPMGIKISGPDLESIEEAGKSLEAALKEVPSVIPATVFYDRAVGAPYIEIRLDRYKMARHGVTVADLQEIIAAAVGGMTLTTTVEGRERFAVRLRYPRELRDNPQTLSQILIPTLTGNGAQIPLGDLADIEYARGAQMIQSENTFLINYVIFDKQPNVAEVNTVREADALLKSKLKSGELILPDGVSYVFAGNYENQERAQKRLMLVIPLCLFVIFLLLYFHNRNALASLIHFSGVFVAFAGGFILLYLYGTPWFMDINIFGENLRDIFGMRQINLSIAVWVGFIALFGIATDDGVLIGTYINKVFNERKPQTKTEIREAVVAAGLKRVRPAVATTATTLIALLPVLTSTGKGADIMIPMAIPTFGGMLIQSMTMFVVPVLQCFAYESGLRRKK